MLQALTRLFRRGGSPDQLTLEFTAPAPRDSTELLQRLRQLGMTAITDARLTCNRNVMVSFGGGALRVHEGYLGAPETVLRAIVGFVQGRTRADRRAAKRVIVSYPVGVTRGPARTQHTHPEDAALAERLAEWHERYNEQHFHGRLKPVAVRVSRRMKSRLGHYMAATPGGQGEVAISRSHLKRHGWDEALHTLLHEMVHQWQDETGRSIDHGATFRAKAREVGIGPYARRVLASRPGRAEGAQTIGRKAAREG